MTSTISSSKNIKTVFNKALKNNIVYFTLSLIITAFVTIITLSSSTNETFDDDSIIMLLGATCLVAGFSSQIIAFRMFKEIYKKQSCDHIFSLPIKRSDIYIGNSIFGVVNIVANFLLSFVLSEAVNTIGNLKFNINEAFFLKAGCTIALANIAIYFAFIVCAVVSGKRIQYILLSIVCLFSPIAFFAGIENNLNAIWGFSSSKNYLSGLSSVQNALSVFDNNYSGFVLSIIEIIIFFIIGLIAFNKRKAENAEISISGKIVPSLFLILLSGSAFFHYSVESTIINILIAIAVAVVMAIIFSAIFYKKAINKLMIIISGVVVAICLVFTICVNTNAFNNYVNYIPEKSEIESVEISNNYSSGAYNSYINSLSLADTEQFSDEALTLTTDSQIDNLINLHKKCIDKKTIKKSPRVYSTSLIKNLILESNYDYANLPIVIKYNLKDGSTVSRQYFVNTDLVQDEYTKIFEDKDVLNQFSCFDIDEDDILCAVYYTSESNNEKGYTDFNFDKFKDNYIEDFIDTKNCNSPISNSYGLGYCSNLTSNDYSGIYESIQLYYIEPDAPKDKVEKFKKMSPKEIEKVWYDSYSNDYIIKDDYLICSSNKKTNNYLDSLKYQTIVSEY